MLDIFNSVFDKHDGLHFTGIKQTITSVIDESPKIKSTFTYTEIQLAQPL